MLGAESAVQVVEDSRAQVTAGRVRTVRVEGVERVSGRSARVSDIHVTAAESAVEMRLRRLWVDRVRGAKRASYGGAGKSVVIRSGHIAIAEARSVRGVRNAERRRRNDAVVGTWHVAGVVTEIVTAVSERGS